MQWNKESKKAFVQALNIKFLTTTGTYTNFQFREVKNCQSKDQICMLFSNGEQREYREYLELVTAKYKGAIKSFEKSSFDPESFPFCINPGKVGRTKFKVSLDAKKKNKIINNLYYVFINQVLSFEIGIANLPSSISLNESQVKDGYIIGWAFSENNRYEMQNKEIVQNLLKRYNFPIVIKRVIDPDLGPYHCIYIQCKDERATNQTNEAVQRAIKGFPTEILRQYPTQLLILFNVFYYDLSAKEGMSLDCEQLVKKMWSKFVHTAEAQGNIVSFDYDGDNISLMSDERVLDKINELYKGKVTEKAFSNFINLTQKDPTTITALFNFDLHNINVIINKVPCDVDYVEKAQEFAIEQRNGTARPIHVESSNRIPRVANDTVPSSSKQDYLQIPGKFNNSLESQASSSHNDSAFGGSPANLSYFNTSIKLHVNAASFDSGHGSNLNSPIKKHGSDKSTPTTSPTHSDVTVINKSSRTGSVANIADLDNLEQKPNKVESKFIRNAGRGKSVPSSSRKVLSTVEVEKWRSLDDIRFKV